MFHIENVEWHSTRPHSLPTAYTKNFKGECIINARITHKYLMVVTSTRLFTVDFTRGKRALELNVTTDRDWDPSGLMCHEDHGYVVIILGQRKCIDESGCYIGRLEIIRRRIGSSTRLLPHHICIPGYDFPKKLGYDPNDQLITCITKLENKVIVWKINDGFEAMVAPFEYVHDRYTEVSHF